MVWSGWGVLSFQSWRNDLKEFQYEGNLLIDSNYCKQTMSMYVYNDELNCFWHCDIYKILSYVMLQLLASACGDVDM